MEMGANDLFKSSFRWFRIIAAILTIAGIAVAADLYLRSAHQDMPAAAHLAELGISWTALTPAGTLSRRPEARHPGVDLRFSPQMPFRMNPADILLHFSQTVSSASTQ